jgi:REP element-mobilizing transposase RayT
MEPGTNGSGSRQTAFAFPASTEGRFSIPSRIFPDFRQSVRAQIPDDCFNHRAYARRSRVCEFDCRAQRSKQRAASVSWRVHLAPCVLRPVVFQIESIIWTATGYLRGRPTAPGCLGTNEASWATCGFRTARTPSTISRAPPTTVTARSSSDTPNRSKKSPTIRLTREQAATVCQQVRATAEFRKWKLFAVAVMANHEHLVIGVRGNVNPSALLRDFKSDAARELNKQCSAASPRRWWTRSGSTRNLPDVTTARSATHYVANQDWPLAAWIHDDSQIPPATCDQPPSEPPA